MRGLAQALLLAPALVRAAPSRMDEKVKDTSPSTFVTFDIPPGFNEDKPQPCTLHLEVFDAPSPCAYPNIKVNDNPLSQGGHTLGRGSFAGDHDGSTFIASWTATCAGDEQLLRFNLESLAGRSLASEIGFVARFRQTTPATITEVAGPVRVSESRPELDKSPPAAPDWEGHEPRPGDDNDGLLEDPPFPPPPHPHVGNHREGDDYHGPKDGSGSRPSPPPPPNSPPYHSEEIEAEVCELDCLRHRLHALKQKIHEKESRLAHEHGIRPHRHVLRECDSLKCVLDTLMHRVSGGCFRGGFHGFGGRPRGPHGHQHHGSPPTCGGASEHGNHTHGDHPLPPPPPGFCHCGPSPPGEAPCRGLPPPFDEPPHHDPHDHFDEPPRGPLHGHSSPPPPPPFDGHHGPPGPPPSPEPSPQDDQEHPLGPHNRRPHPHGDHHHGPHPPSHGVPLFAKITGVAIIVLGLALWTRMFASAHADSSASDEEKQAFISGGRYRSNSAASRGDDDDDQDEEHSMSQDIAEFRNAATMVTEMVAAEEARERRQMMMMTQRQREQQDHFTYQQQQRQLHHPMNTPPSPTTAFADYMVDDALPTYDEAAPTVVVSDGFSSYTPGSSDYTPSAPDGPAEGIDDVLGDTTTKN